MNAKSLIPPCLLAFGAACSSTLPTNADAAADAPTSVDAPANASADAPADTSTDTGTDAAPPLDVLAPMACPKVIALGTSTLFVATCNSSIYSLPKAGGNPSIVATIAGETIESLSVAGNTLFVYSNPTKAPSALSGTIHTVSTSGGTVSLFIGSSSGKCGANDEGCLPYQLSTTPFAVEGATLYFNGRGSTGTAIENALFRVPAAGGTWVTLNASLVDAMTVLPGGVELVVARNMRSQAVRGEAFRVPTEGGVLNKVVPLGAAPDHISHIASDGAVAYLSGEDDVTKHGQVISIDLTSGVHTTLYDDVVPVRDLDVDGSWVWFSDTDGVKRVPKTGGAANRIAADKNTRHMAGDASHLYWITSDGATGHVARLAR